MFLEGIVKLGRGQHFQRQFLHESELRRPPLPPRDVSYAIWLYHRFTLSLRDVEDILAERGVLVIYEAIRFWCWKFGCEYTRTLRKKRGQLGDTWHVHNGGWSVDSKRLVFTQDEDYSDIFELVERR